MKRNYSKFYTLISKSAGLQAYESLDEFKEELVSNASNGRTTSLSELSDREFIRLMYKLEGKELANNNLDSYRKRVIASIFGLMGIIGKKVSMDYVKAIAVRAAGGNVKSFNKIPKNKLIAIYNMFLNYQKTAKNLKKEEAILEIDTRLLSLSGIELNIKPQAEA